VLKCVAVFCSMLQRVAVWCVGCSILQQEATSCLSCWTVFQLYRFFYVSFVQVFLGLFCGIKLLHVFRAGLYFSCTGLFWSLLTHVAMNHVQTFIFKYERIYMYLCVSVCVHIYIYKCICMCIYIYSHTYTCMKMNVSVHV